MLDMWVVVVIFFLKIIFAISRIPGKDDDVTNTKQNDNQRRTQNIARRFQRYKKGRHFLGKKKQKKNMLLWFEFCFFFFLEMSTVDPVAIAFRFVVSTAAVLVALFNILVFRDFPFECNFPISLYYILMARSCFFLSFGIVHFLIAVVQRFQKKIAENIENEISSFDALTLWIFCFFCCSQA